ncbi:transcriptional regulator TetR family [Cupriavidus necator N-1]|uniref:Transcriptional regulator TetR family n=1 Tax=Cupriavidus necator (strain ATCC 43291 / DSM 13513 / CCUG 52238 / LMG 8453 / N-1) TaxID=1042878 RepID=G0EW98_CUPNN|nr:TetR/AcrR family transcriptional regulator [Cupriavidus necator]AEI77092.1 transcriptional regulator TetR family [Cupriavidus necator N-1]MDX6014346.1 TetR/AcrR family transcriptional regulator [Cupriavidus necator]
MPQVKKPGMREAILAAAFDLFCRKGYTATTMSEIARAAGMTVANLYVYFDSKLLIFYEIYTPWLLARLDTLRESVQKFPTPRTRLRRILVGLWGDIPAADHSFANAMIEALASAPKDTPKPNNLLERCEVAITDLVLESLPPERAYLASDRLLAHILWMAYDGFAINSRIGDTRDLEAIATLMTDMMLGPEETREAAPRGKGRATRSRKDLATSAAS